MVVLFLTLTQCQKEQDLIPTHNSTSSLLIKRIDYPTLSQNIDLTSALNKLQPDNSKTGVFNRMVHDPVNAFMINTSQAVLIDNGTNLTYNFEVYRQQPTEFLENLAVIIQPDGSYNVVLVQYNHNYELLQYENTAITATYTLLDYETNPMLLRNGIKTNLECNYSYVWDDNVACNEGDLVGGSDLYCGGWVGTSTCYWVYSEEDPLVGGSTGGEQSGGSTSNNNNNNNNPVEGQNGIDFNTIPTIVLDVADADFNNFLFSLTSQQFTYFNNLVIKDQDKIRTYLEQNQYSEEAKAVFIEALENLSSYTEISYPGMELDYEFEWWLDDDFVEDNFNFGFDVGGGLDNLTAEEKVLVALFPAQALIIMGNKEPAETETENRFGNNGINNKSDAFRHAFFNAMNTNDVGDIVARKFSNAHESETPPNLILEKQMDLHNNNIGHNIGSNASTFISDQELSNLVYQSLIWGSLRYLSPLTAVIPPNYGITSSTQLIPTNQ